MKQKKTNRKTKLIIMVLTSIILSRGTFGQNVEEYDLTCYCSGKETPHRVITYDNNFEILYALRDGMNKEDLDKIGIPYTLSQLKLLQLFNLLEKNDDGQFYTSIPILDSAQTQNLRDQSRELATKIYPHLEHDITKFVRHLNSTYESDNAFSILFSYVLDGKIWNEFERKKLIDSTESDDCISTWTGHSWMVFNPRTGKCGTNSSSKGNTTIYITNGVPWRFMKPLYENYELMKQMISDINNEGKIIDHRIIEAFGMYDLFDQNGNVKVPVIEESRENKLYTLSGEISHELATRVIDNISLDDLMDRYNFRDRETALIVFYHEFMWDFFGLLKKKGVVKKPKIFSSPESADMTDMTDLIFFVSNRRIN